LYINTLRVSVLITAINVKMLNSGMLGVGCVVGCVVDIVVGLVVDLEVVGLAVGLVVSVGSDMGLAETVGARVG
jgi:hypothetical protein